MKDSLISGLYKTKGTTHVPALRFYYHCWLGVYVYVVNLAIFALVGTELFISVKSMENIGKHICATLDYMFRISERTPESDVGSGRQGIRS